MSPPVPFVVDTCLLFHVSSWLLRMLLRCVCVCALVGSLYNSSGVLIVLSTLALLYAMPWDTRTHLDGVNGKMY
jgi:hypothetical protein